MSETGKRIGRQPQELLPRFWSKVDKRGPDECWPWTGSYLPNGYGAFWLGRNNVTAHRVAYMLLVGCVPEGLMVRHACDHRWCVNPAHLAPGTHVQNMSDKVERERQARGESHGMATKTEAMVLAIKQAYALGRRQTSIAFCAGVDRSFVNRVIHGDSWGHVAPELTVIGKKRVARHSDEEVRRIKAAFAAGERQSEIVRREGVDPRFVNRVVRGLSRGNVT